MDPSTVQGAVFWGVVAGVATSALLALLSTLVSKVLLPWYLQLVYRGVDLRGDWTYETAMTPSGQFSAQLSLEQRAHKITGQATIRQSGTPNNDYVTFFTVEGSTWEGFLMLNLQSKNRKVLSYVTGLFKVTGRGEGLEGHWVYRSASTEGAESAKLEFLRAEA